MSRYHSAGQEKQNNRSIIKNLLTKRVKKDFSKIPWDYQSNVTSVKLCTLYVASVKLSIFVLQVQSFVHCILEV